MFIRMANFNETRQYQALTTQTLVSIVLGNEKWYNHFGQQSGSSFYWYAQKMPYTPGTQPRGICPQETLTYVNIKDYMWDFIVPYW